MSDCYASEGLDSSGSGSSVSTVKVSQLKTNRSTLPGIPSAPVHRGVAGKVDKDFEDRKRRYAHLLPIYTETELDMFSLPYHELVMKTLLDNGYRAVVDELDWILDVQSEEAESCLRNNVKFQLATRPDVFKHLAETLKFSQDLFDMRKADHALNLRKELASEMLRNGTTWLARLLLKYLLRECDRLDSDTSRLRAECHCLLAYIVGVETCTMDDDSAPVEESLKHLKRCRELSRDQPWNFRNGIVTLRLKKPIYFHGLRKEEKRIDGNAMHLYMIASLLEHEMLIKLVNQIVFNESSSKNEVFHAVKYADDALQLAIEVNEPTAVGAALIRIANVLYDIGAYEDAMDYYDELQTHAELRGDREVEAMGYNGLGLCFKNQSETLSALEMFSIQQEKAAGIHDLQAQALEEMGKLLLEEGQVLEANECILLAERLYQEATQTYDTPKSVVEDAWALTGISQGLDIWGRYVGLSRRFNPRDVRGILRFKSQRSPLPVVRRPEYAAGTIPEEFVTFDPRNDDFTYIMGKPFITKPSPGVLGGETEIPFSQKPSKAPASEKDKESRRVAWVGGSDDDSASKSKSSDSPQTISTSTDDSGKMDYLSDIVWGLTEAERLFNLSGSGKDTTSTSSSGGSKGKFKKFAKLGKASAQFMSLVRPIGSAPHSFSLSTSSMTMKLGFSHHSMHSGHHHSHAQHNQAHPHDHHNDHHSGHHHGGEHHDHDHHHESGHHDDHDHDHDHDHHVEPEHDHHHESAESEKHSHVPAGSGNHPSAQLAPGKHLSGTAGSASGGGAHGQSS